MYVTNSTLLRRDRGLTEAMSYNVLEGVLGVYRKTSVLLYYQRRKNY